MTGPYKYWQDNGFWMVEGPGVNTLYYSLDEARGLVSYLNIAYEEGATETLNRLAKKLDDNA